MQIDNGFIKIHRSILKWEWYDDVETFKVFFHLILTANHEDRKWHGTVVKRGQRITSYAKLASETKLSVQQIRTILNRLESTGEITRTSTSRYTVITVENYSVYQCRDDASNKQTTRQSTINQQTSNKRATTNKNDKNDKNYRVVTLYKVPDELKESVEAFVEMRKRIKAPMTDRALSMMLKKLNTMSGGDMDRARAILDQSTIHDWKGIYPLKEERSRNEVLDLIGGFDDQGRNSEDHGIFP